MPPRSAKKEPPALWFQCDKCRVHITSKDREEHDQQHCPITGWRVPSETFLCSYVHDKILFTTSISTKVPTDSLVTDLPDYQLNGFVFICETTMKLCSLKLGDLVVCTSPQQRQQDEEDVAVVRTVWAVPDRNGTSVFITEDELQNTWHGLEDFQLVVQKLTSIQQPSSEITLASIDPKESISDGTWNSLKQVLSREFYSRVLCKGSRIKFEFYNKIFTFRVTNITGKLLTEREDSLESILENLTLKQPEFPPFFTVTRSTIFKLEPTKFQDNNATDLAPQESKIDLIGGLDSTIRQLREHMNLAFGRIASMQGMQVSRSVLLYGLPGCGKTLLCEALAIESNALVIKINASEIFSKYFGETEANLIKFFDQAFANYPNPTVIIIEEIANVCAKEIKEDSAKRVSSAFLNMLDSVHNRKEGSRILVLSTTSNIENINPAGRRCGRIDIEIEIPVPNPSGREEILQKHLQKLDHSLTPDEIRHLANVCHGFVGADLASLIAKGALHAINTAAATSSSSTGPGDVSPILRLSDLQHVLPLVKPSAMREVLIECPNVKWSDIGGQSDLKLQLKQAIEWPLTNPEKFLRMGINPPRGILMFGPPGCSKTMIAKALATESKVNFLSIKGPELFSMWVGESEKAVRELFRKARTVAPAIIFFDEIDAIGGERSSGGNSSSSVKERVLAQMLTEMDGVNALQNVTIVAATNRPDLIDKALMRPGRIDRIVYVRLPDAETRAEIFRIKMRKMPIDADVDVSHLVEHTDGYSGAEVQAVCQEAALKALEDDFDTETVKRKDFEKALQIVLPRTNADLLRLYDDYLKNF